MPFELKNAPSEFLNIMNNIFNQYSHTSLVYIDDILIFSYVIVRFFYRYASKIELFDLTLCYCYAYFGMNM